MSSAGRGVPAVPGVKIMSVMPFDQREGVIWFNGDYVPWKDAKVHVLTHGLHYASAVFEGERAYGGEIFKLTEHTERLFASAEMQDIQIYERKLSRLLGLSILDIRKYGFREEHEAKILELIGETSQSKISSSIFA